jgi:hypothetical protein
LLRLDVKRRNRLRSQAVSLEDAGQAQAGGDQDQDGKKEANQNSQWGLFQRRDMFAATPIATPTPIPTPRLWTRMPNAMPKASPIKRHAASVKPGGDLRFSVMVKVSPLNVANSQALAKQTLLRLDHDRIL